MPPVAVVPNAHSDRQVHERDGLRAEQVATNGGAAINGGAATRGNAASFDGELARRLATFTGSPRDARQGAPQDVAPTRTPLSGTEAASALSSAWRTVTGQPPSPKLLSILV